jgi:Insect allergen related repeat, nitrile-specifier detoxification
VSIKSPFVLFKLLLVNEDGDDMGGMNAFFSEALSLIPQDEVLSMFFAKMEESNAFSSFLEKINASDYENLTESLKVSGSDFTAEWIQITQLVHLQKSQGLQAIYFEFHAHGIDIMEWAKALRSYLGY